MSRKHPHFAWIVPIFMLFIGTGLLLANPDSASAGCYKGVMSGNCSGWPCIEDGCPQWSSYPYYKKWPPANTFTSTRCVDFDGDGTYHCGTITVRDFDVYRINPNGSETWMGVCPTIDCTSGTVNNPPTQCTP